MIGIIDYDAGNIKSVEKALAYIGEETIVSRDPEVLLKADKAILPGVGSFGQAMENLHRYNLVPVIKDMVKNFLPIENSDDWIMSILSNNIKVDKDGEETLEICGVMG